MKQRGIASFFGGGKPENHARAANAKAVKSTPSVKQEPVEPVKEANASANKRSREVIKPALWVGSSQCNMKPSEQSMQTCVCLLQDAEVETTAAAVQEPPRSKLKRLRKAGSTETSPVVSCAPAACRCTQLASQLVSDPMLSCLQAAVELSDALQDRADSPIKPAVQVCSSSMPSVHQRLKLHDVPLPTCQRLVLPCLMCDCLWAS